MASYEGLWYIAQCIYICYPEKRDFMFNDKSLSISLKIVKLNL